MSTVTLKNIRKTYTDTEVIKGIDLEIKDREFAVFIGPLAAASLRRCG